MEHFRERSLRSIMEGERQIPARFWSTIDGEQPIPPSRHSVPSNRNQYFSPRRHSSASDVQLSHARSPESPWTRSPLLHPAPSPTYLLYHCVASLHRRQGTVYSIAISGGMIFSGSQSSRVRIWRQPDCTQRGCLRTSSGEIRAILAYGNMLFTTHKDYKIRVWRMSLTDNLQPSKMATLPRNNSFLPFRRTSSHHRHTDYISCLAYYHTEGLLYTGSWDKTVKVWSVPDKKCIDSFVAHEDNINSILVNQEDGCLFTSSSDGSVKIWRKSFGENSHNLTTTLNIQNSPVNALALSSSRTSFYLYSGSSDGSINFWEQKEATGRYTHGGSLQGHHFSVLCLVAVQSFVFSGSEDTTIRVWRRDEEANFHECLAVLEGHRGPVKTLAACLEMENVSIGFLVYSASLDRTLKVWRVKVFPGEQENATERETSPVLSPAWVEKKLQDNHLRPRENVSSKSPSTTSVFRSQSSAPSSFGC